MKTFQNISQIINYLSNLNIQFERSEPPDIQSFVPLPPQLANPPLRPIFHQSLPALHNTLNYCVKKLRLKCRFVVIHKSKIHSMFLVQPNESPKEYMKYLTKLNHKLYFPKKFMYKGRMLVADKNLHKRKDLRFMNCIVSVAETPVESADFLDKADLGKSPTDFLDKNDFYLKRLLAVNQIYPLPDGIFMLNASDCLVLRNDGKEPWVDVVGGEIPLLSHNYSTFLPIFNASSGDKYCDIPLPTFDDLQYVWGRDAIDFNEVEMNWSKKKNIAVFRGTATGCGYTANRNPRLKAVKLSQKYPYLLNAGITKASPKLKIDEKDRVGYIDLNREKIPFADFIPFPRQSQYKYILHLDGNVAAYRLAKSMLLQSTILMQESGSSLWYSHLLKPYIHYVPIKKDLSDLIEKIKWCQNNDSKCKEIAMNGFTLASKILTEKSCFDYMANVFWNV